MSWAKRDWTDVRPGDYIQDGHGRPWLVKLRGTLGEVRLEGPDNVQAIVQKAEASGPVWIWDAAMETGVGVLARHLGARVVGDTAERKD